MTFNGLNYFSLLIPLFFLTVSLLVFVLRSKKLVSIEIVWFSAAIFVSACAQILQTALLPEDIYMIAPLVALLFLISIVLCTHAVYLRLNIPTKWNVIISSIILSISIISYYSYIEQNIAVRFSIVALTTMAILFNNGLKFIQTKHPHILDRLLKLCLCGSIFAVLIRALILVSIIRLEKSVDQLQIIWASSQFLILFFTSLLFALLASCSILDSIRKLEHERNIDPLTGLLNRRALREKIEHFNINYSISNAILVIDLDHFKRVNDQYGHLIGDLALQHVSHIMRKNVRCYDEVARIGGEEFVIILKDITNQTALNVAEKIRKTIENTPLIVQNKEIHINVSIGFSFFSHPKEFENAFNEADSQLYRAKNLGRNQTISTSVHLV